MVRTISKIVFAPKSVIVLFHSIFTLLQVRQASRRAELVSAFLRCDERRPGRSGGGEFEGAHAVLFQGP